MNGKKLTPAEDERLGVVEAQLRELSDFRRELERAVPRGDSDRAHELRKGARSALLLAESRRLGALASGTKEAL